MNDSVEIPKKVFGLYKTMTHDEFVRSYLVGSKGLLVARCDSRRYMGDDDTDYIIKRCFIYVQLDRRPFDDGNPSYHLITCLEVETLESIYGCGEHVYIPLPEDIELRNKIIELIKKNPDFWRA